MISFESVAHLAQQLPSVAEAAAEEPASYIAVAALAWAHRQGAKYRESIEKLTGTLEQILHAPLTAQYSQSPVYDATQSGRVRH